jgi:RNA polymerase sigma factor for flagellar operon FliA
MLTLQQQIVESYGWACHYANCCTANFSSAYDREELKSVGIFGYIAAASRYDKSKGNSFRGFCATRIRGAIMDELRRSSWEPRSVRRTNQLLSQKRLALEAQLQRNPTSAELAQSLGITEGDLRQLQVFSQPARCISLDDDNGSANDDESLPLKEIIPDQTIPAPPDAVSSAETRHELCLAISKLSPMEASIIVLHYMRSMPFHDIARQIRLTPSRISQLHHHALSSLKKILKENESRTSLK